MEETPMSNRNAQSACFFHYLFTPFSYNEQTYLTVSPNGADVSTCGWDDLPCLTIQTAVKRISSATLITLSASSHASEASGISITKELTIRGEGTASTTKALSTGNTPLFVVSETEREVTLT